MAANYQDIHKEIIELSKLGNTKAQYQLYKLYSRAMYNICYRMMKNKEEAEDLLQESFGEAFLKLDTFRYESSFGAWIKKIVINKCINSIKRKKAELILSDNIQKYENIDENDEIDYKDIKFKVEQVQKAVDQLPDGYRVIFSLYSFEGYDHSEIAEILNISESTSKSQYHRAKLKLVEFFKTELS